MILTRDEMLRSFPLYELFGEFFLLPEDGQENGYLATAGMIEPCAWAVLKPGLSGEVALDEFGEPRLYLDDRDQGYTREECFDVRCSPFERLVLDD